MIYLCALTFDVNNLILRKQNYLKICNCYHILVVFPSYQGGHKWRRVALSFETSISKLARGEGRYTILYPVKLRFATFSIYFSIVSEVVQAFCDKCNMNLLH